MSHPRNDAAARLKTRRRLTLDLFTHHGDFWQMIAAVRAEYGVHPTVCVPPQPDFHAEVVGLMDRWQMPERFHMPPDTPDMHPYNLHADFVIPADVVIEFGEHMRELREIRRQPRVAGFLWRLKVIWSVCLPDDIRSGTNALGHLSWTPFLSACVMFEPPPGELREFADHDDHLAAVLPMSTFWQDPDDVANARISQRELLRTGDSNRYGEALEHFQRSYRSSTLASTQESAKRGAPPIDDLVCVQCALWRRDGISSAEIGQRLGKSLQSNVYDNRKRSVTADRYVALGEELLKARAM